ncbi:MAG: hypothetical protein LBP67_08185 [Bacteroidales bacterium]|jgi:hypothetical protein|nr:hypothetical protein [Bacteroidales bacterium]
MNEDINSDNIKNFEKEIFSYDMDFFNGLAGITVDILAKNNDLKSALDLIYMYQQTAQKADPEDNKIYKEYYEKAYALCNDYLTIYKDEPELLKNRADCAKELGVLFCVENKYNDALKYLDVYNNYIFGTDIKYNKQNVNDICLLMKNKYLAYYGLRDYPSAYNFLDSLLEWKYYEYSFDVDDKETAKEIDEIVTTIYKVYPSENLFARGKLIMTKGLERIDITARNNNPLSLLIQLRSNIMYAYFLSHNDAYRNEFYNTSIKCFKLSGQLTPGVRDYQEDCLTIFGELYAIIAFAMNEAFGLDYEFLRSFQKSINDTLAFLDLKKHPRKKIVDLYIEIPKIYAEDIKGSEVYKKEKIDFAAGRIKDNDCYYIKLVNYFNSIAFFVECKL